MIAETPDEKKRRVFGRVDRSQFVGRADELQRIVEHPHRLGASNHRQDRRLLLRAGAPSIVAGCDELKGFASNAQNRNTREAHDGPRRRIARHQRRRLEFSIRAPV